MNIYSLSQVKCHLFNNALFDILLSNNKLLLHVYSSIPYVYFYSTYLFWFCVVAITLICLLQEVELTGIGRRDGPEGTFPAPTTCRKAVWENGGSSKLTGRGGKKWHFPSLPSNEEQGEKKTQVHSFMLSFPLNQILSFEVQLISCFLYDVSNDYSSSQLPVTLIILTVWKFIYVSLS